MQTALDYILAMNATKDTSAPPAIDYPASPNHALPRDRWMMIIPVICANHASKEDMETAMSDDTRLMHFTDSECGPIVHWDHQLHNGEIPEEFEDYSPEFHALVHVFNDLGYHYIRLDGMAETVPGLPTFDW